MSEELIQRNLIEAPEKMGDWNFYNIGATTLKALKSAKIIPNHDYDEFEGKKPDALIVKKPIVIAAIEYKTPSQLRTNKQIAKAITQEIGTARALQARVYIITDGKKSIWINPATGNEILQEDGNKIALNFDKKSADCIVLINKIRGSINSSNDTLRAAASVDPLPLAEKVWQDLWAVSGATPENCLYTFVEIFIFKYLSDLGILSPMHSFYHLLGMYSGNNENDVLEYYAQTIRVKIKELFPWNPKDKTTIINGTIFSSLASPIISFASNGDGSAGRNFILHDRPFYICADRVCIKVVCECISPVYVRYALRNMKEEYGFNHAHKANKQNLSSVTIPIPLTKDNSYNLDLQNDMAMKFLAIEQCKQEISQKLDALVQQKIEL